jgi:serine/threonine-protein kinase
LPESGRGLCPRCLLGLAVQSKATDANGLPLNKLFGDYELLERIGQGGFGVVFRARQRGLDRLVALKLLRTGAFATDAELKRFRAEAQAVARLQHPNIVTLHEVGECEGQPFYSMELISGAGLDVLVKRGALPPDRAASYVRSVADGIHYAHTRGLLHRDLKPANVLLDDYGQPKVTDFGLARSLAGPSDLSHSGDFIGTLLYASPEQAAGRTKDVGVGSDVWALGATLYELLTGRPPFTGETVAEVQRKILGEEPVALRTLNPAVPRDLETVCLKCLAKDPGHRYREAKELAADLGRFLRREPVRARPVGVAGRFTRWCRRKPAQAVTVTTLFVLLGLLSVAAGLFRRDLLASNAQAAQLAALAIHAELAEVGHAVERATDSTELRGFFGTGDWRACDAWLGRLQRAAGILPTAENRTRLLLTTAGKMPAARWLRSENWYLLDARGQMLAHWPVGSRITNVAFRDYFIGAVQLATMDSPRPEGVHFSRVYQGVNDGLHKFGISRVVRDARGEFAGVLVATVTTTTTERQAGLSSAERKTVLIAATDTNAPPPGAPPVVTLPEFVVMLHPAFREREPVVAVHHPALPRLLESADSDVPAITDSFYRDPVGDRYDRYKGRWLAGFARVPETPFVVIFQTRDWIGDAALFAFIVATGTGLAVWNWVHQRRKRMAPLA